MCYILQSVFSFNFQKYPAVKSVLVITDTAVEYVVMTNTWLRQDFSNINI